MWDFAQAKALRHLFDKFDEKGIQWAVFRNFEGLPEENPSKDVDLLVRRDQIPLARKVLCDTMKANGYTHKSFTKFQCIWCYSFFKESDSWDSIKIDLFYGQVWRGVPTVSFETIYNTAVSYNGFKVPCPEMNAFLLWVKTIMTGGRIKEKYVPQILEYVESVAFRSLISQSFGNDFFESIKPLLNPEHIRETAKYQKEMCKRSWKRGFIRNPLDSIVSGSMHFLLEAVRRMQKPKGSIICLLGPDGVGKSTVIEKLSDLAKDVYMKDADKVEVIHFRPNILPNLKKLLHPDYDESKEEFTQPHRAAPAGKLSSIIRLMYYWIDYRIGWHVIKKKCVNGALVIFDRYSYDFIVDPRRTRLSLKKELIQFFMMRAHKPDAVFILDASPEIIYSRKKELELDEIERQEKEYHVLARGRDYFHIINAEQTPDAIVCDIMKQWIGRLDRV